MNIESYKNDPCNESGLRVTEIQRFCMHDGPGIRTTVFLKGCPLRCRWCHNPETQKGRAEILLYGGKCLRCGGCSYACVRGAQLQEPARGIDRSRCIGCGACAEACPTGALELCGREMTVQEILAEAEKDLAFYGKEGGVTLSGGEPLFHGERAVALLKACKSRGLTTAVETCGYVAEEILRSAIPYTDLFLWDIKDTDDARHQKYTGVSNETILQNLALAGKMGARIRLRCILIKGINTDKAHYERVAELAVTVRNLDGVEIIPYHAYAGTKAVFLGGEDNGRADWIPEAQDVDEMKKVLCEKGIFVL